MAATPAPNPRASLLAGLRTGGVRSASGSMPNVPHTAAPAGTFNIPRIITPNQEDNFYPPEEEDELSDMMSQNLYIQNNRLRQAPVTAAVDGIPNRFQQQQQHVMNMNGMGYNYAMNQNQLQQVQLQLMQMELARMQALQAQQYQAELLAAQAAQQRQRQAQQGNRRAASNVIPSTAGPMNTTFDMRSVTMNAQMRRANQADQLRSKLGVSDDQVPMTAALNGRFGSRIGSGKYDEEDDFSSVGARPPATPSYTTVISGGTSLGAPATPTVQSKSDAAVSWRRAPGNNSVLSANRTVSSPTVKVTPPPGERVSPPPGLTIGKARPTPLRFTPETSNSGVAAVAIDTDGPEADDSSTSSKSNSSPSTPQSASSVDVPPLSPREEASKKLYEGLGLGRPVPGINVVVPQDSQMVVQRLISTPVRQPRGPPSNNEELVPKNFATRSRRKAVDSLLEHARERQVVVVEAY
ncbi:hypothetical protein BD309DRAFT_853820 [Dichomitus squalens]|uniref:Uncharacterized protein n=1 Tax=Dichomitus squalens TaxID=114155 RepID=A0A4Q9PW92_9APHY|nr:hypothetical protein BD309DRAFT_853820 [Dichomitus squalens]TBU58769.1 hypothetical protein BD310DRAFT_818733 [Dichomitus squalens]